MTRIQDGGMVTTQKYRFSRPKQNILKREGDEGRIREYVIKRTRMWLGGGGGGGVKGMCSKNGIEINTEDKI